MSPLSSSTNFLSKHDVISFFILFSLAPKHPDQQKFQKIQSRKSIDENLDNTLNFDKSLEVTVNEDVDAEGVEHGVEDDQHSEPNIHGTTRERDQKYRECTMDPNGLKIGIRASRSSHLNLGILIWASRSGHLDLGI